MKHETVPANYELRQKMQFLPINPQQLPHEIPPWALSTPSNTPYVEPASGYAVEKEKQQRHQENLTTKDE